MRLTVNHTMLIRFEPARRRLLQSLRLYPTDCASQKVRAWDIAVSQGQIGSNFTDGAGDETTTVSTPGEVEQVTLSVTGEVETFDTMGVLRDLKERVNPVVYLTPTRFTRADSAIDAMTKEALSGLEDSEALDRAHRLSEAVSAHLSETRDLDDTPQSAMEAQDAGKGGQTAYAHLLIGLARKAEIPARFVYGYHAQNASQIAISTDDEARGAAVVSPWPAHVWAELWVAGLGWVGFDPLRECCPDEHYIRICSGRDAADAAPLRGFALGLGSEAHEVALDVSEAAQ